MSLRDELRQMCPFNESPRLLDAIIEKVERALAAERAAVWQQLLGLIDNYECLAAWRSGPTGNETKMLFDREAILNRIRGDRSALDFAKKMAAAEARHEMNQTIGEHLGQDANEKSMLQMLDDALTQARTEMFDEFFSVAAARYGIPAGKHSPESILAAVAAQEQED